MLYKDHGTYLWCASTDDPSKPTHILTDPNTTGKDKRKLDVKTILDWLLSLKYKYDPVQVNYKEQSGAIFVMFGSGYDITQILAQTTLTCAHNTVRRVDYDDDKISRDAPEYWGEYAFSYIKGKWFDIWRLRDPDNPTMIDGSIDAVEHIKIYDTFGYFQKKFADVVDDMVKRGMASEYEQALIKRMKARRGMFAEDSIEEITEYCLTECRLLSKQMNQLREMCFKLDLRPASWHGPGAVASTIIKKRKLAKHFGEHIAASDLSEQQDWAHHAFVGARIESLKQGYLKSGALHSYDVASCYPAGIVELPSLAPDQGEWKRLGAVHFATLVELLARIEKTSIVSMFEVRWNFPAAEKRMKAPKHIIDPEDRRRWELPRAIFVPFFPLPYRTKSGAILFPSSGRSRCMRDDLIAAIKWMMKFIPNFPVSKSLDGQSIAFEIEGAWIWEEVANSARPFTFVRDYYDQRRAIKNEMERTGVYDPMEMVIKLIINSLYGKLAQFVGTRGKIPKTANPYFAAAITAYGRRRLCEAGLIDPHAITFFATDGIVSTRPLTGLDRVKTEGRDVINLGDWEYAGANGGLFVGSGIYIYWKHKLDGEGNPAIDDKGNVILKPVAKLRGASARNYKVNEKGEPWLVEKVLPIWKNMRRWPEQGEGLIIEDYKQFVTIGSALSPGRWKIAGRWSPEPGEPDAYKRVINAHELGVKRRLNRYKLDELVSGDRPAKRTFELIPTIPQINRDPNWSRSRPPEWLDNETGEHEENEIEFDNVAAGSRSRTGWRE